MIVNPSRTLGEKIRTLRLDAGLTQRELALRMGFNDSIIALTERGERAPTQQFLDSFADALKLAAHQSAELYILFRTEPTLTLKTPVGQLDRAQCPYRGLYAFREQDALLFHGRDMFVKRLISKFFGTALVGVVGASGSGKSSVVAAGLIPVLRTHGAWLIAAFRPGADPFEAVGASLVTVAHPELGVVENARMTKEWTALIRSGGISSITDAVARHAGHPVLLFADQFEELFTHCRLDGDVEAFLDAVTDLVERHPGATAPVKFLLTLRGDFYGRVVAHRRFSDALQDNVVHLPPMTRAELRNAVSNPARVKNLQLEPNLVERILDDVGNEPGNLPLLEYALTLLWEQQETGVLTHAAYDKIGTVSGAIATQAEEVYSTLAAEQQDTTRQLLTRLVRVARPDEEGSDARRRTPIAEVDGLARIDRVIAALADARLVVSDVDKTGAAIVEVSHEAVIRNWARLRAWLDEDRQFLLWRQRMRQWYTEWQANPDDDAAVLRGRILAEAQTWVASRTPGEISTDLLDFINHSIKLRDAAAEASALARVELLLTAQARELPGIVESFDTHQAAVRSKITTLLQTPKSDFDAADTESQADQLAWIRLWRLHLALAPNDAAAAQWIAEHLECGIEHAIAARDVLRPVRHQTLDSLWATATGDTEQSVSMFHAAIILADYVPDDERWQRIAPQTARALVLQNQLYLRICVDALQRVATHLIEPLAAIACNHEFRDALRETAVTVLLDIAGERGDVLARLVCDGPQQVVTAAFETLSSTISTAVHDAGVAELHAIAAAVGDTADESALVRTGKRRAASAAALLRLQPEIASVLRLFIPGPDPELATQFAHHAKRHGIDAATMATLLDEAPNATTRYAFLMALGAYDADDFDSTAAHRRVHDRVLEFHHCDSDAGVHAAAEWLDRRWGRRLKQPVRAPYDPLGDRNWFTADLAGFPTTFTAFAAGTFTMGSPECEEERSDYETQHTVTLTKPFALCTRQFTRAEFEAFMTATSTTGLPNIDEWSSLSTEPVVAPTWDEAVECCHWLSRTTPAMSGYVAVSGAVNCVDPTWLGFRLPTEAEWEYACRTGTATPFSFGNDRTLIDEYAWTAANSGLTCHEAGILRPSPAGLFNIHGQCWEWCSDWYGPYPKDPTTDPRGMWPEAYEQVYHDPEKGARKVLRGGCWNLGARYARSACRNAHIRPNRNYYITFRVAASLPTETASITLPWAG